MEGRLVGATVSTVQLRDATGPRLPAASVVATSNTCAPSASDDSDCGLVQAAHAAPSRRHEYVSPGSAPVKVMVADVVDVVDASAGVTDVIDAVLTGAVVSTVNDRVTGEPWLPRASTRRTESEWAPSARPVSARGDVHGAQAPAPSTWHS